VSWRVVIPGQPPSLNHAYHPTVIVRGGKRIHTISKTDEAATYQAGATQITKVARPSGWTVPRGQRVRIRFWYYLNPAIDLDNIKKLVIDAVSRAIPTDDPSRTLNDRWVMTCDVAIAAVPKGQQRLELEIDLEALKPHV
jgi:hypothetical protein